MARWQKLRRSPLGSIRRFIPAGHRLFAVFGDDAAALAGVAAICSHEPVSTDDIWLFRGKEGADQLDPYTVTAAGARRAFRVLVWIFSNNVEYLATMADLVRRGGTAMAVGVSDELAADRVAQALQPLGGSAFAYATHWNFVPIVR